MHQVLQAGNVESAELSARENCSFSFSIEVAYVAYKFCSSEGYCNKCCEWKVKTITRLKL